MRTTYQLYRAILLTVKGNHPRNIGMLAFSWLIFLEINLEINLLPYDNDTACRNVRDNQHHGKKASI